MAKVNNYFPVDDILRAANPLPELKECPKCKKIPITKTDKYGHWRCFCASCNRWEGKAALDERKAINSWNDSINSRK